MQILHNKTSVVVILLFALWLLSNDITRLIIDDNTKGYAKVRENISVLQVPQLNNQLKATFDQRYAKYNVIKKAPVRKKPTKPKKSLAELERERATREAKQSGRLNSVFAGDNILRLKAVIESKEGKKDVFVALIEVRNTKTKKTSIEEFNVNSNLSGFNIVKIENTAVYFSRKLGDKQQNITLVMYKS